MEHKHDQIKIEYSITDKEPNSVRIMCVFLILIFALVPLAEIVVGLEYHSIESYPSYFCAMDFSSEPLSFKEIR
ncbi:hypothetical protein BW723_06510 [Polaribacter reichenbachii]|uniref:Uncharacterized protein n=1 Tax=Polaribacter reichenbachii TaxID=996801 RepID=A0A1B8U671_9FLAO|nr:hypothetical protein [Polaribacter reichenbachii]APZ45965.1 hypothetical protein BW723_06510 [Polaribacter reichenbachii]AUC19827.1 hypothetical protein BTO17_14530 [Polaribacter reichenbachii]OBY67318.1 hypothetical protein LPB301_02980 [Polaribacter reichenbachii]